MGAQHGDLSRLEGGRSLRWSARRAVWIMATTCRQRRCGDGQSRCSVRGPALPTPAASGCAGCPRRRSPPRRLRQRSFRPGGAAGIIAVAAVLRDVFRKASPILRACSAVGWSARVIDIGAYGHSRRSISTLCTSDQRAADVAEGGFFMPICADSCAAACAVTAEEAAAEQPGDGEHIYRTVAWITTIDRLRNARRHRRGVWAERSP